MGNETVNFHGRRVMWKENCPNRILLISSDDQDYDDFETNWYFKQDIGIPDKRKIKEEALLLWSGNKYNVPICIHILNTISILHGKRTPYCCIDPSK